VDDLLGEVSLAVGVVSPVSGERAGFSDRGQLGGVASLDNRDARGAAACKPREAEATLAVCVAPVRVVAQPRRRPERLAVVGEVIVTNP
jgi:hypothetical protein